MKKFLNLKSILCCVAILFGLISALMLTAPAIIDKYEGDTQYTGLKLAFGGNIVGLEGLLKFGVSAYMLPLFLAIIGLVLIVLALLGKGGKVVPIVAAVCFLGAGICYFLAQTLATPNVSSDVPEAYKDIYVENFKESIKDEFKLAGGAIVGGVFGIIAALASAAVVVCPLFIKSNND